jgi:hypothetical protein
MLTAVLGDIGRGCPSTVGIAPSPSPPIVIDEAGWIEGLISASDLT